MRALLVALALAVLAGPARAGDIRAFVPGSWKVLAGGHAGRPLAVHFWSLGCAPCIGELPEWARLVKAGGIDVVLVSTDSIDEAPKLKAMLKRHGLDGVEAWAFGDPFAEKLRFEIDRRWRGELPMTRLVDASGTGEGVIGTLESGLADRLRTMEGAR